VSSAEQWLRQLEEQTGEALAEAADLRTVVTTTQGRARSADGLVSAVVAPGGALVSLELDERVMDRTAHALQHAIVDTIRRAGADAAAQLEQAVRPVIGDRYDEALKAAGAQMPELPELDEHRPLADEADDDLSQENVFGGRDN
jgi:DNA-binding protein YbaB